MTTNTNGAATSGSSLQDHRQKPRGVLPRQLQMWLMVGIAAIILLVILITGRPQPAAQAVGDRPVATALPAADRIRAYQQQLKDEEARLHQLQAQAAIATGPPCPSAIASTSWPIRSTTSSDAGNTRACSPTTWL